MRVFQCAFASFIKHTQRLLHILTDLQPTMFDCNAIATILYNTETIYNSRLTLNSCVKQLSVQLKQ
jgi:hypothetical protein